MPKLARFEVEIPESDENSEDDSEEEMAYEDSMDDESESDVYSEETQGSMESSDEREVGNIFIHCKKDDMPIVHRLECPRCYGPIYNSL